MNEHEVLVVGGGPVGLMTAAELASAGVDVAVLERRTTPDLTIKAGAVTGGAVQALDHRGLLEAAQEAQKDEADSEDEKGSKARRGRAAK